MAPQQTQLAQRVKQIIAIALLATLLALGWTVTHHTIPTHYGSATQHIQIADGDGIDLTFR